MSKTMVYLFFLYYSDLCQSLLSSLVLQWPVHAKSAVLVLPDGVIYTQKSIVFTSRWWFLTHEAHALVGSLHYVTVCSSHVLTKTGSMSSSWTNINTTQALLQVYIVPIGARNNIFSDDFTQHCPVSLSLIVNLKLYEWSFTLTFKLIFMWYCNLSHMNGEVIWLRDESVDIVTFSAIHPIPAVVSTTWIFQFDPR